MLFGRRYGIAVLQLTLVLNSGGDDFAEARRGRPKVPEFGVKMDEFGVDLSKHGRDAAENSKYKPKAPDRKDKNVARQLKCSICAALVHELHKGLPKYSSGRVPSEFEVRIVPAVTDGLLSGAIHHSKFVE